MAAASDKGYMGEQGAGFFFGKLGYYFVDGPSGAGGHAANASGFDGVAYNPTTDQLIKYDNKAYSSTGNVAKASAIDPMQNLAQNLQRQIDTMKQMRCIPNRIRIIDLLQQTQRSLSS